MRPSGAHTHHDGGGAGAAAAAVLALMIVAAFARPLLHVLDGLGHALAELLHALAVLVHVLFIAAVALAGAAVAAGAGLVAWKLRHPRRRDRPAAPYTATVVQRGQARRGDVLPPRAYVRRPELGRPAEVHLHLHGLTPDQAAEAIARHAQQHAWPQEGDRS
jgi:hypothetical protein